MKLSEVKEVFTHITKLPAKKVFAIAVVEGVGQRRMMSITDWLWAIDHIRLEFRIEERETKLRELQETQAQQVEKDEPKDDYEAVANSLQEMSLNLVELFLTSLFSQIDDRKLLYRELAKHLHPDTTKSKNQPRVTELFLILKDIYDISNNQENENNDELASDEELGKNASEIPF